MQPSLPTRAGSVEAPLLFGQQAPIASNQFMLSPFAPSFAFETAAWCQQHGVAVVAHSPLAGMEQAKALAHEAVAGIAAKHASLRSPTQASAAWRLTPWLVLGGAGRWIPTPCIARLGPSPLHPHGPSCLTPMDLGVCARAHWVGWMPGLIHSEYPLQVMLKWAIQKGYAVIPGTGNPAHMLSNLEVYGAELSAGDMATLDALKDHKSFFYMDMREAKADGAAQRPKDEP